MHPNCRSTIVPYLKEWSSEVRIARDPRTGQNISVADMGYSEWKDLFYGFVDTPIQQTAAVKKPSLTVPERVKPEDYATKIGVSVEYWTNQMEVGERQFVRSIYGTREIQWITKGSVIDKATSKLLPTNDFLESGVEWELKTPAKKKYSSIRRMIADDAVRGKKNFEINLGGRVLDNKLRHQLSKYNDNQIMESKKINRLRVYSKNGLDEIKLK